ncbi:hypothetical protein [Agromyces sp. SYSU T00266]|uniref:hypothetical protein n=1 Tax=Agromyces zhanjiangensis TaxID=3158562 RepID=UPI003391CF39
MQGLRGAAIAVALLTASMLTACTAGESPDPTVDATADPAPTATPAGEPDDPLALVTRIVIRPLGLELVDDAGTVLETLSYDLPADEIVEPLSAVFDSGPDVGEFGQCCEAPLTTNYAWPGFEVWDDQVGQWDEADPTVWVPDTGPDEREMNVVVVATAPELDGVALTTDLGFEVDADPSEVAAAIGSELGGTGVNQLPLEYGPELGESVIEGELNAYAVALQVGGDVRRIIAPLHLGVGGV